MTSHELMQYPVSRWSSLTQTKIIARLSILLPAEIKLVVAWRAQQVGLLIMTGKQNLLYTSSSIPLEAAAETMAVGCCVLSCPEDATHHTGQC